MKLPGIKYSLQELFRFKNSSRSVKTKKNIIILVFIHTFNFFCLMALVPVTISYLGNEDYGIWLTLASILSWLINIDFGIGNGLRNKLAEAFAMNNIWLARVYVSTAYAIFTVGIIGALVFYSLIHEMLNWASLLNAPDSKALLLNFLAFHVIILFLVQLLLKLITSIINADQKPALSGALSVITNSLTLLCVYLLSTYTLPSLTAFGVVSSAIPVIVLLVASVILFGRSYRNILPSVKFINLRYSSNLFTLSLQFFVIQISSLVVFTTGNIIIAQLFGSKSVVTYNIAHKYFFIVPTIFNVVLAPFWSAFTEAFVKEDYLWIKRAVKKLMFFWVSLSIATIIMIIFSNFTYEIWVGPEIQVPFSLSLTTGVFVTISNWNNIFGYFINGTGKIRIQFYYSILIAIMNIPLSIFLAKYLDLGLTGIMVATVISLIFSSIWAPLQYYKLINKTAKGIWNK